VPDELDALAGQLTECLAGLGSALIAFSGGVDSSLVAALAARALGERALAVTAVSPALASGELDGARSVARAVGVRHELISTAELERDDYRRNDRFRCYYCKSELYERLAVLARRRGFAAVLSGANADDTGDWRPGLLLLQIGVVRAAGRAGPAPRIRRRAVRRQRRRYGRLAAGAARGGRARCPASPAGGVRGQGPGAGAGAAPGGAECG